MMPPKPFTVSYRRTVTNHKGEPMELTGFLEAPLDLDNDTIDPEDTVEKLKDFIDSYLDQWLAEGAAEKPDWM